MRYKRGKTAVKSKAFAERLDQRMSMASNNWKPTTPAAANAVIRHSMASNGNRASGFSCGAIRPVSSYSDVGSAGVGAQAVYQLDNYDIDADASTRRPRLASNNSNGSAPRASRVSFAADPRPSESQSRKSLATSRAFHNGYIPPVPASHDQLQQDAHALSNDDIAAGVEAGRDSMADFMPALTMMRASEEDNNFILPPRPAEMPTPPSPTHAAPQQPELIPANVMTPDAMLQAYAARKAALPPTNLRGGPAYPPAAASYNGNGMRTLYTPDSPPQQYSYSNGGYTAGGYMNYTNGSQ